MRRICLVCTVFLAASSVVASDEPLRKVELLLQADLAPQTTVPEILEKLEAGRTKGSGLENITDEGPTTAALILGAANAPGRFGSYFTTDVFFVNPFTSTSATVTIFALPPNRNNFANLPPSSVVTLPPRSFGVVRNILGSMGVGGGAALLMGSQTSSLGFSAWAYTSTAGPSGGRYGVNIHAIGRAYTGVVFDGWCTGVNVGSSARTNLGVFNYSTSSTLFLSARVYQGGGGSPLVTIPFSVPPLSFSQVAVGDYYGGTIADGLIWLLDASGTFSSYMVVNDNVTNDANFQLATGW